MDGALQVSAVKPTAMPPAPGHDRLAELRQELARGWGTVKSLTRRMQWPRSTCDRLLVMLCMVGEAKRLWSWRKSSWVYGLAGTEPDSAEFGRLFPDASIKSAILRALGAGWATAKEVADYNGMSLTTCNRALPVLARFGVIQRRWLTGRRCWVYGLPGTTPPESSVGAIPATSTQRILAALAEGCATSQGLGERTGLSPMTVKGALKRLRQRGQAERQWDAGRNCWLWALPGVLPDAGRSRPVTQRSRILRALEDGPGTTSELASVTAMPRGTCAAQLHELFTAGLIRRRPINGRPAYLWGLHEHLPDGEVHA